MQAKRGEQVDHRNGNGLDNRRCNLRSATHSQQQQNTPPQRGRLFKGVSKTKTNRWVAKIKASDKVVSLGTFKCPLEAAKAYDAAAKKYFGEYARTNF